MLWRFWQAAVIVAVIATNMEFGFTDNPFAVTALALLFAMLLTTIPIRAYDAIARRLGNQKNAGRGSNGLGGAWLEHGEPGELPSSSRVGEQPRKVLRVTADPPHLVGVFDDTQSSLWRKRS